MCKILSSIENHNIDDIVKESLEGPEFRWQPLKLDPYDKKLQEHYGEDQCLILDGFVEFLSKSIKPTIDPDSCAPVEEMTFSEEYANFCELDRIVASRACTREEKLAMISVPKAENIRCWTEMLYCKAQVTIEISILTYILLKRLLKATGWRIRSTVWRSFVIIALNISQKHEECPRMSNRYLHSTYSLFTPKDYSRLEAQFLALIDYKCVVQGNEFFEAAKELCRLGRQ